VSGVREHWDQRKRNAAQCRHQTCRKGAH
jgi:hypothetical protein